MIVKECKNLESTIHFYTPFEYTCDIVFSFSVFQDVDLVHYCITCPKNKILFNLRPYLNVEINRAKVLSSLDSQQKNRAIKDIRKATGINRIKELVYGGNGLFQSSYISRCSLENVISYFELQERTFGDMSVMSWDGYNGWGSEVVTPTPFKDEVKNSNGNHLPIIERLIRSVEERNIHTIISADDYKCLDEILSPATRIRAEEIIAMRSMELIDKLGLPMHYDSVAIKMHPTSHLSKKRAQDNPVWLAHLKHAKNYVERMEKTYPFLKWDLETSGSQQKSYDDIVIAYMKKAIPNWVGGEGYDDYGRLITPPERNADVANTAGQDRR